ncbi:MAG: hypothetical protein NXH70_09870 [Hyphomonas sp.]|nr:hypothetical protein [Hyphomonas sp.]
MDELDPAREIIVEAITTLEDAIEDLMTGQAPRSSKADIVGASASLRKTAEVLRGHAERIDDSLKSA